MLFPTHVVGGIAAGMALTNKADENIEAIVIAATIAGFAALLPDLDTPNSFLGRRIPMLPGVIENLAGHRGATHSILAAVIATALFTITIKAIGFSHEVFIIAFFLGYLSHLILDIFNPAGVPMLWPIKLRFRIPLTKPGGLIEKAVIFPAATIWIVSNAHQIGKQLEVLNR